MLLDRDDGVVSRRIKIRRYHEIIGVFARYGFGYLMEQLEILNLLQSFPFAEVRALIESEFDDKLENVYKEFEEKPLAAASVSQVHCARLNSGKPENGKWRFYYLA